MSTVYLSDISKPVAVGLEWYSLPGVTAERKEIASKVQETGNKIGVIVRDESTGAVVLGLSDLKKTGSVVGAAWLSRAVGTESAIVVEPINQDGDDRVWLCAVRAGTPVPGMDRLVKIAEAMSIIAEFLESAPDTRIYSVLNELEVFGSAYSEQSFSEIVASTAPVAIKRIHGISPAATLAIFASVVLIAAVYGYGKWSESQKQQRIQAELSALNAAQAAAQAQEEERLRKERLEAAYKAVAESILSKPSISETIAAISATVSPLPAHFQGWDLSAIACDSTVCQASWERTQAATVLQFLKGAEEMGWEATAEGSIAQTSHKIKSFDREPNRSALEQKDAFEAALESKLQELELTGVRYEMVRATAPAPQVDPATQQPGQEVRQDPQVDQPKMGAAILQGDLLATFFEAGTFLEHPAVSMKNVHINIKEKNWKMEFNYATQ